MPSADFFRKRGFLIKSGFLEPALCVALCAEGRAATASIGEVGGDEGRVDLSIRNASEIVLTTDRAREVERRLEALGAELADQFALPVVRHEGPRFLIYRTGSFYRPHPDCAPPEREAAGGARRRRVSGVIFLNAMSPSPRHDEYRGGALTFYGLFDDPPWHDFGFALDPTPGLLVAFPSDVIHEVTPVTAGERYTVVDWFHV